MTIVRNPYTRVLSAWNKVMLCQPGSEEQYLAIKGQLPAFTGKDLITLSEFVDYLATQDLRTCDAHWLYQTTHLFLDVLDFNLIGKTENMADVLQQFAQRLGRPEIAAERRNASHASSGAHYDPEIARRDTSCTPWTSSAWAIVADDWPVGDPSAARVVSEEGQ